MSDSVPKRRWFRDRFVADGPSRVQKAAEPEIRAQVIAEYSAQLKTAGLWRLFWLRRRIEREITIRVSKVTSSDALY